MDRYRTAIITDSTCDIPEEVMRQYDIRVVPTYIIFGEESLRDGVDIQPAGFYERLQTDPNHPKTSQPTPQDFLACFETARQDGAEEIAVFTLSSSVSGTYNSAVQAGQRMDIPVHVHDSRFTSMALGWQVLAAARERAAGGLAQSMILAAEKVRARVRLFVTIDTARYLYLGGRVSAATHLISSVLNIKPLVYFDAQDGEAHSGIPSRTRRKGLQSLYDNFFRDMRPLKKLRVAVMHSGALGEAKALADRIRQEFAPLELMIQFAAPVLGVHAGPRAVGLCGYCED